jgi:hypothetical protein
MKVFFWCPKLRTRLGEIIILHPPRSNKTVRGWRRRRRRQEEDGRRRAINQFDSEFSFHCQREGKVVKVHNTYLITRRESEQFTVDVLTKKFVGIKLFDASEKFESSRNFHQRSPLSWEVDGKTSTEVSEQASRDLLTSHTIAQHEFPLTNRGFLRIYSVFPSFAVCLQNFGRNHSFHLSRLREPIKSAQKLESKLFEQQLLKSQQLVNKSLVKIFRNLKMSQTQAQVEKDVSFRRHSSLESNHKSHFSLL